MNLVTILFSLENKALGGASGIFRKRYKNFGNIFIFNIFILPITEMGNEVHRSVDFAALSKTES